MGQSAPSQVWTGRVAHPRSGWGGTPSQVWMGGYPIPGLDGGYMIPGLDERVPTLLTGNVPPFKIRMGVPPGTTTSPSRTGWSTPLSKTEWGTASLSRTGWGTSPPPPPPIRRQISKASTCYAEGGVSLALTQEDFLVLCLFFTCDVVVTVQVIKGFHTETRISLRPCTTDN